MKLTVPSDEVLCNECESFIKHYAKEQVIKELSDWVQFTKSIKPSVLSMMKDRIKELKQKKVNELT